MANKKKIRTDDVFGELTHVVANLWLRPIEIVLFGVAWTIRLGVAIRKDGGLEENQIVAFETFIKRKKSLLREAEKKLFAYYQSACEDYRGNFGITRKNDKKIPIIESPQELSRLNRSPIAMPKAESPRTDCHRFVNGVDGTGIPEDIED